MQRVRTEKLKVDDNESVHGNDPEEENHSSSVKRIQMSLLRVAYRAQVLPRVAQRENGEILDAPEGTSNNCKVVQGGETTDHYQEKNDGTNSHKVQSPATFAFVLLAAKHSRSKFRKISH